MIGTYGTLKNNAPILSRLLTDLINLGHLSTAVDLIERVQAELDQFAEDIKTMEVKDANE